MPVDLILQLLFKLLFLALTGYYMRRRGLIDDAFQKRLSAIIMQVALPLNLLAAGSQPFDASLAGQLLWCAVIATVYHAVALGGAYLATRKLPLPLQNKNLYTSLVGMGNTGFMGIPVAQELFGEVGALYGVVIVFVFYAFLFTAVTRLLEGRVRLQKLLLSPTILACAAAIALFCTPLSLPRVLADSFSVVGGLVTPLAMFVVGSSLAGIPFASIFTDGWAWLLAGVRQLLLPAVMAGALWLAGLRGVLPVVCLLLLGMPSATANVILAEEYELDIGFATRGVVLSTLLIPFSLAAQLWAGGPLFLG